ncbi:MAG: MATE family efflux transporter [Spirochaetaceae bacterium]|nr:MATE family efflux transporter [Spirochaetaceae bacterium]
MSSVSKSYQIDMTSGPILVKLLGFSIPLIFSSTLQLLFNAADVIVVGRFAGENSLAAVGATGALINLMVNLFVGLSVGTTVVTAHFFGAGKESAVEQSVHTGVLMSLYSGIILTVVGIIGTRFILQFMQVPVEIFGLASLYLKVYFAGITASMVYNFGSALLRAKGDTRRPMYYLLFAGIINVILNLIFVIVFKMDVAGVALATIISQCVSAFLVIRALMKEEGEFHLDLRRLRIEREILIRVIKIGVPAGFQGMVFSLSNIVIQSAINGFGAQVVAGSSAAGNIEGFIYTAMNGFAQGALTFSSQNLGAGRLDRVRRSVVVSELSVLVTGLVLGGSVFLFRNFFLGLYSDNPAVIASGATRITIICLLYALCGMMETTANMVRGLGHSLLPMVVSIAGVCGMRILWIATIFQVPRFHTFEVLFYSYPVTWTITLLSHAVCLFIIFRKYSGAGISGISRS